MRRCVVLLAALLAACATADELVRQQTEAHGSARGPDYAKGYSDGCMSGYARSSIMVKAAYTRDEARFRQDRDYAAGWDDGRLACNFPESSPTWVFGPPGRPGGG